MCCGRCRWLVNKGTQLCMLCVLHAWGVDMSECALRKDKRKNLLVPVDAWMQMCHQQTSPRLCRAMQICTVSQTLEEGTH